MPSLQGIFREWCHHFGMTTPNPPSASPLAADAGTPTSPTPALPALDPKAAAVLDFWLGDGLTEDWPSGDRNKIWFANNPALDQQIREQFGPLVQTALDGGLKTWEAQPLERLALIILLDQFSRNLHRGEAGAFAGDARAQQLVLDAIGQGWHRQLPIAGRVFLFMPLMHAEDLALQQECVIRFTELHDTVPEAVKKPVQGSLDFAQQHRDIIARFGRFPYRNAALGRTDTHDEREFLVSGPRFGQ